MNLASTYTLDTESIKLNAYRLLCLFHANKEIARQSDPGKRLDQASQLERAFFAREMTHLLLNIAIGVRVLDDQMRSLPRGDAIRDTYMRTRDQMNRRYKCMMFDEMPLREVCNKVIHATTVEAHSTEGAESHTIDEYNWLGWSEAKDETPDEVGPEPKPIAWEHLTGNIRLGGTQGSTQWWQLLQVPVFVESVCELLAMQG